jgi:hypothetical protein
LGGNSRTSIICTITAATVNAEETNSTLKFASRAKTIQNKPQMNEVLDDQTMLKKLQKEVQGLKEQLREGVQLEQMLLLQDEKRKVTIKSSNKVILSDGTRQGTD